MASYRRMPLAQATGLDTVGYGAVLACTDDVRAAIVLED